MPIGRRLFSLFAGEKRDELQGPVPERLTYAVGDIHGRLDLLDRMLFLIEQDRAGQPADIVFLGDYIDRGLGSAGVLRRLYGLNLPSAETFFLMGNHERMFLDFLQNPENAGPRWLHNGGRETLTSFVGAGWSPPAGADYEKACRDRLLESAGPDLLGWVGALLPKWRSGDLGCVHAMADPLIPWEAQPEASLLWGRPQPKMPKRKDGLWIAHGHTVVKKPQVQNRRIALDTGAFATGILSAGRFEEGRIALLSTDESELHQL